MADPWRSRAYGAMGMASHGELHSERSNKLGEGEFGSVYWGQLWNGSQIAVKRLKVWSNKAEREFAVEVEILARVRHKNLLSLRGYCAEGQERLIVYDYMPNFSLLSHLHGQHSAESLLYWPRRMTIAIGSAEGIVKEKGKKQATWRIFSLKELHSATNNFNYDNKLGEGGFGSVYWGQLWDGSQIAVKRLKVWSNKAEMEFSVEVEILARVRHKNLLSLRGYCAEGQERLIVYDYMPNLSLLSHLHGQHSAESLLDWTRRMTIAIGSAEGIVYLHHHATPHIIHRDIKASNVLLDSDFNAQVADFGFAKLIPDGATHVTTRVKGTLGYLAPEYAMLGKASESCDVYSFGILLLELASGKKPIEKINATRRSIAEWALPLACERKFGEMADPSLNGKYVEEELKRVVILGLICASNQPEKRPTMLEVVELLKGELKEKFAAIENDEMFKTGRAGYYDDGVSVKDEISEEKEAIQEIEKAA